MRYLIILLLAILTISCKSEKNNSEHNTEQITSLTTAQKIANAHGYEHWNKVSKIDFIFNVDRGENHSERSWQWQPKTNDVTLITGNDTISYNHKKVDSTNLRADQGFINDKYWLLAPFNLVWDEDITITEAGKTKAPISKTSLNKITLTYSNEGGYTPGDAYDFYYGDDYLIKEWTFRQANKPEPSLTTAWGNYQDFNGIKIATEHTRDGGGFKLYFTDVKVQVN